MTFGNLQLRELNNQELPHRFNSDTLWNLENATNPYLKGINTSLLGVTNPQIGDAYHINGQVPFYGGSVDDIAIWTGGAWAFTSIQPGFEAVVEGEGTLIWTGTSWSSFSAVNSFSWSIPASQLDFSLSWSDQQGTNINSSLPTTRQFNENNQGIFVPLMSPSVEVNKFFYGRIAFRGTNTKVTFRLVEVDPQFPTAGGTSPQFQVQEFGFEFPLRHYCWGRVRQSATGQSISFTPDYAAAFTGYPFQPDFEEVTTSEGDKVLTIGFPGEGGSVKSPGRWLSLYIDAMDPIAPGPVDPDLISLTLLSTNE